MKLTIYSTPTCPYCITAKEYLKEKGVVYEEKDISQNDENRQEMTDKSGQISVPVIVFKYKDGSEKVLADFENEQIDAYLTEEVEN